MMSNKKPILYTTTIEVKVSEEMKGAFKAYAEKQGKSMAEVLRSLIEWELQCELDLGQCDLDQEVLERLKSIAV